jgi:hypothetical protein
VIFSQLVKKFSLYWTQKLAICLYPQPNLSIQELWSNFFKAHFNIFLPSKTSVLKWFLPFRFYCQYSCTILFFLLHVTLPACVIALITLNEEVNQLSSVSCSFLQTSVTSSLTRLTNVKGKGKAIPKQAWRGLVFSRKLKYPRFKTIGTWKLKCCQPHASTAFTSQEVFLVLISVKDWNDNVHAL